MQTLENKPYIWSSSTLYTNEMKSHRQEWFHTFKQKNELTSDTLLDFHKNAGIGDPTIDLQINRGHLKTRSITQIVKNKKELSMRYENLQNKEVHTSIFETVTV